MVFSLQNIIITFLRKTKGLYIIKNSIFKPLIGWSVSNDRSKDAIGLQLGAMLQLFASPLDQRSWLVVND